MYSLSVTATITLECVTGCNIFSIIYTVGRYMEVAEFGVYIYMNGHKARVSTQVTRSNVKMIQNCLTMKTLACKLGQKQVSTKTSPNQPQL